ncbi:YbaN family protein [Marinospirillum perlucidum]|uniref:YbaN family protein n=1 Tax=Marinospirillum perlucidum TaxID=1982602 RepID=UPI000DF356BE|nr:YbaN family protein [Marinospirillum perlucidum]
MLRWFYLMMAGLCMVLVILALLLPLVPATPFLLLAAWFANRGSPRFHRWLWENRYFRPILLAWEEEKAIPASVKKVTLVLLLISGVFVWSTQDALWIRLAATLLLLAIGGFLLSRPTATRIK